MSTCIALGAVAHEKLREERKKKERNWRKTEEFQWDEEEGEGWSSLEEQRGRGSGIKDDKRKRI